ncbi:unnamed protein product, partial [Lampetra planeri]
MAEAALVPQHRFFCHCCKCETSPKLPDFVCPRCESGFIEEVTDDSSLLENSTSETNDDSSSFSDLWQLLFMERSALLSHPPSSESDLDDSEQVHAGQTDLPSTSPVREPESSSQLEEEDEEEEEEEERSTQPQHRPAVEGIVQQFLADLFANNGNPGAAPAALMLQLHSNPGDYAWGQGGLDAVITE